MGIIDTILKVAIVGGVAYAAYLFATGSLKLPNGKEPVVPGGISPLTILVPGTAIIPAVADVLKEPILPDITTIVPSGAEVPILPSPAGFLFPIAGLLELIEKLTRPADVPEPPPPVFAIPVAPPFREPEVILEEIIAMSPPKYKQLFTELPGGLF